MKSLTKAVVTLTIFSVLTRLMGFIFRIFLAHSVGESGMAIYQISLSLFFVLTTLVASGLPSIISRQTAIYISRKESRKTNSSITVGSIIVLVLSLILCCAVLFATPIFRALKTNMSAVNLLYLMLPAFIFAGLQNVFRGYIWGSKDFLVMSLIELAEQVVRIAICVVLSLTVTKSNVLQAAAISLDIACFLSFALSVIYYFKHKGKMFIYKRDFKILLKSSAPITAVRLIGSLIQPIMATVIPLQLIKAGYTNNDALSLYGATVGMVMPLLFLPSTFTSSLAMALIPDISSKYANNQKEEIRNQIKSSLIFTCVVSLILVPIFSSVGLYIGKLLFDSEIAGHLLEMSSWIMLPLGLSALTSSMLNSIGMELKGFVNYCIGAIFLILSIIILPKYIGINSIIVGIGVCMSITTILNLRLLSKKINANFNIFKIILILIIFLIPTTLIVSNIFNAFKNYLPVFVNLTIVTLLGLSCYMVLCLVFNIINYADIKSFFTRRKLVHKS